LKWKVGRWSIILARSLNSRLNVNWEIFISVRWKKEKQFCKNKTFKNREKKSRDRNFNAWEAKKSETKVNVRTHNPVKRCIYWDSQLTGQKKWKDKHSFTLKVAILKEPYEKNCLRSKTSEITTKRIYYNTNGTRTRERKREIEMCR